MTLVKQNDSTFIRLYDDVGYIYNNLTKKDRLYSTEDSLYLAVLSREPRTMEALLDDLYARMDSPPHKSILQAHLEGFVADLEQDHYLITGDNAEALAASEPDYEYANDAYHPRVADSHNGGYDDTSDYFFELFQQKPRIFRANIDITSRCNERCRHCYLPEGREKADLDTDLVLDVLDQLAELNALSVTFSGGEAFLHRDLDKMLRRARENDLSMTVLTNGTHVSDDMVRLLKEVRADEVQLTLFSMDPEVHDSITRLPGSHKKALDTVERLIAAEVPLDLSCPVVKANKSCFKDVVLWARKRRIKVTTDFVLMACTDFDTANLEDTRLDLGEVEELIRGMFTYDEDYIAYLNKDELPLDPRTLIGKPVCGAGRDTISLAADGKYYFCPLYRQELGDVRHDRIADIWQKNEHVIKLREVTWTDFPKCTSCDAFHFCSMCFARNYNENDGDILDINSFCCEVAFLNKRLVDEYWQQNDQLTYAERFNR